jgi:hypothetical protein
MARRALKRFSLSLSLVLAAPLRGHAYVRGGRVPENWAQSDMAWGVLLVIFLGGALGAAWGARRPSWDAPAGFMVGALAGFAMILLGAVAFALLR